MLNMFWKAMPILTIGLVGLQANHNQAKSTAPICGLKENECLARSCKCAMGGAFEFDFLYWNAENPGFSCFAYEQKNPYLSYPNIISGMPENDIGSLVRLDSKWNPGFRIGAGWNSDFDRWDVFVNWTWFKNHSHESETINGFYPPSYVGFLPISIMNQMNPFQNVSSSWRLAYNAVDLELGRAYYITKSLSFRPHWGLRNSWINQKSRTHFYGAMSTYSTNIIDYVAHAKNNFGGIGPRLGIHSQWHIANSSWSILGKASASLLFGETRSHFRNSYLDDQGDDVIIYRDFKDKSFEYVPNLQVFLGLNWGSCWHCDQYYFGISAGWETNIYWNQYIIPAGSQASQIVGLPVHSSEAVTMGGLTANIHFDF